MASDLQRTEQQIAGPARSFLRLAIPTLRSQIRTDENAMSEQLSETHMRALFADDLRQKPLMSRLGHTVRAPSRRSGPATRN